MPTEVDLILVDGESVDFSIASPAASASASIPCSSPSTSSPLVRLRPGPCASCDSSPMSTRAPGRYLRLLGFDTRYDPRGRRCRAGATLGGRVAAPPHQGRAALKHGELTHGYFVRATSCGPIAGGGLPVPPPAGDPPVRSLRGLQLHYRVAAEKARWNISSRRRAPDRTNLALLGLRAPVREGIPCHRIAELAGRRLNLRALDGHSRGWPLIPWAPPPGADAEQRNTWSMGVV